MQKFKTLADAVALAEFAHRNQQDKAGFPYVDHPKRVMRAVQDRGVPPYVQMAAVLHDVTEDTAFTTTILLELGFSESVVKIVKLLDRDASAKIYHDVNQFRQRENPFVERPANEYQGNIDKYNHYNALLFGAQDADTFYYEAIKRDPTGALIVKEEDIADNSLPHRRQHLSEETQARHKIKYDTALDILHSPVVDW